MVSSEMPAPSSMAIIFFHPKKCCFDSDSNKIVVDTCKKEPTAIGTMIENNPFPAAENVFDSSTAAGAAKEKSSTINTTVSFL